MRAIAPLLFAIALVAETPSRAPAPGAAAPVGPEAVWGPPARFLEGFHAACDALGGPAVGPCFVAQIDRAGVSAASVSFAHRIGDMGYLRQFRNSGRVDVALAEQVRARMR